MYEINPASDMLQNINTTDGNRKMLNDKEQIIKNNYIFFGGISLLYGIVFAFCTYRNLFGATFVLTALSTVAVLTIFLKKINLKVKKETKIYFTSLILCGISTCFTANILIQFFNWCWLIVLLMMAMLSQFFEERQWNVFSYIKYLIILFFTTIGYFILPLSEGKENLQIKVKNQNKIEHKTMMMVLVGTVCAAGVLFIVFPLLLSSDLVFKRMFENLFSIFDFDMIFPNITTAMGIIITALIGFVTIYAFFYASCHAEFPRNPERKVPYYNPLTGITFSLVIAFVYLIYSGIQIIYLFLGTGLPDGITYSEYARSGFFQLVAVAFINVGMVLVCMYLFRENRWLKGILTIISFCTFIMIISAAYRMTLYVSVYHLTVLRVLVYWALAVLSLVMAGVIASIYKKRFPLIRYMTVVIVCGYLLLAFAKPDYWIAKYNVSHMDTISRADLDYMMFGLSMDAAPVIAEIPEDKMESFDHEVEDQFYEYFSAILEDNRNTDFRKTNFSRLRAKTAAEKYLKKK